MSDDANVADAGPEAGKLNADGSTQDGCVPLAGLVLGIGLLLTLLCAAQPVAADALVWDRSTLALTGQCLPSGVAEFTVTNGGQDMAGPSAWREYELGALAQTGTLQLVAAASQTFTFGPVQGAVEFQVDQRPGHPGSSHPKLTLNCTPTAVKLSGLRATRQSVLQTLALWLRS